MNENMELVKEINSLKPLYEQTLHKLNETHIRLTDADDKNRQLDNYIERMKDTHGKTVSANDELKESLRRALERINALQLKVEFLVRESGDAKNELAESRLRLEKLTESSEAALAKKVEENRLTVKNLSGDFNSILTEKERTESDLRQQLEKERHKYKTNMTELNAQVKSLTSQLAVFENLDVDSYNKLKSKYEVINSTLEFVKEEHKTLKKKLESVTEEYESKIQMLEISLTQLQESNANLSNSLSIQEQELERTRSANENISGQLLELKK